MQGGREVFTSLIQQMRGSKKLFKMCGESWKFRCQQQCLARLEYESTERPVAPQAFARQNTHASFKPTNRMEGTLFACIVEVDESMKITLQVN